MSGASSPTEWTCAEYARLPDDGNRYEVLDGEVLVTPSPGTSHQRIASELFVQLWQYVREQRLGELVWDLDLLFVTGQFLRPDMMFVPNDQRHLLTDRGLEGVPGLVIEIVSPSSRQIDMVRKPARYADFGVAMYGAVDRHQRAVLVWDFAQGAAEPRREAVKLSWQPDPKVRPFDLTVAAVFDVT